VLVDAGQLMAMVADTRHSAMRRTGVVSCDPSRVSRYIVRGKTIGMVIRLPSITGRLTILPVPGIAGASTAEASTMAAGIADGRHSRFSIEMSVRVAQHLRGLPKDRKSDLQ
jgi:hypothetical protein